MRTKVNWLGAFAPTAAGLLLFATIAAAAENNAPPPTTQGQPAAPATDSTSPPPTNQQPPKDETKPDPDEKICKVDQMTGTRVGRKVCKTRKEWEEAEKEGHSDF